MSAADEELPGQEQLEFFDRVWSDRPGFVQLVQRRMDENGDRTGDPTDVKWFKWPMERERIGRYVDSRLEDTLYFACNTYAQSKRQEKDLKYQRAIYVDDDGVTGKWNIEPTFYVVSSPGHSHAYWVLDDDYDPKLTQQVGFEISKFHKHDNDAHGDMGDHKFCGTDPGGWDATQILRVPGSVNNKAEYGPNFKFRVVTEEASGAIYSLAEMQAAYPHTEALVAPPSPDTVPEGIPNHTELLTRLGGRADLLDLFMNEPTGRGNSQGWDERLYALENELFRIGFTETEVFAVAWHSACNKFKRGVRQADGVNFKPRPHPDLDLWRDVLKAKQQHDDPNRVAWQAPGYDGNNSVIDLTAERKARSQFTINLLTEEERAVADARETFVTKYIRWATSKTDAATVYHEASAFTILSVIFSEFGHAFPKFGKLRLNLWFLVMGKTTRARKSTSRGLMMRILDGMSGGDYHYDEGSDFTSEGLIDALLGKNRRSSLIHKDEVQGLFKAVGSKNYMSDLSDTLTDLYDGKVGGKKRAGGVARDSAETNFIMFLMGIVGKITNVLTLEDFQSGFLARFLHVIGEAPERTRESEWLDQADISEIISGDPGYMDLISDLMQSRKFWEDKAPAFFTVPVFFEEEAWRRWNDANWELQEAVRDHERAEILEAAVDRMGKSAIKAAVLLAMADMREKVNVSDVIVALKYTSVWATHMVRSAEMISESFFKKDMKTLTDMVIAKGGAISWSEAYAKLDKEPHIFKSIVEGAVMSSLLTVRVDDKSKTRWLESTEVNYANG